MSDPLMLIVIPISSEESAGESADIGIALDIILTV